MSNDSPDVESRVEDKRSRERVLYARKHLLPDQKAPVAGGEAITEAQAVALRNAVFGAPAAVPVPRPEWLRTAFTFRAAERELAYGLTGGRSTVRGLLAVVQAHVVRHLLFGVPAPFANSTVMSAGMVHPYHHERLLRPTVLEQQDALCVALSAILWRVGEQKCCVLTLPQDESYLHPNQNYCPDGVTEKLQIFELTSLEDLQIVIKRYLYLFQAESGPGALLLLYSAVLTRGIDKVLADLDQAQNSLIGVGEEGSTCVVMLLLTGRATPYLHNGVLYVGDEEHYVAALIYVLINVHLPLMDDLGGNMPSLTGASCREGRWACCCGTRLWRTTLPSLAPDSRRRHCPCGWPAAPATSGCSSAPTESCCAITMLSADLISTTTAAVALTVSSVSTHVTTVKSPGNQWSKPSPRPSRRSFSPSGRTPTSPGSSPHLQCDRFLILLLLSRCASL